LLISVPFGGREVSTQLFCRAAWTIARCIALNAPSLLERARIYRVEAELVEQPRDENLRPRVVSGDDQSPAVLRSRGTCAIAPAGSGKCQDVPPRIDKK
jgi:hypothetical protein